MTLPAIRVEDVSVAFRPFGDSAPTLRRLVNRDTRRQDLVHALRHVSFEIQRGEAFGIIGRNGAGKSTLMRIMARTLRPNSGSVQVAGTTSTLLQLGVGFNPELTGRRNVFLGSLAAGANRATVEANLDGIIEFAEIGEAIDRPMKTYSSGMFARLAFSVSMHMNPDILLLDEILAVGDAGFREKSLMVMNEMLDRSGTIVLVSHNLRQVSGFCDRAIWLDNGTLRSIGPASDVVVEYRSHVTMGRAAVD